MILYHRTNRRAAEQILKHSFRDSADTYLTDRTWSGVWLSNVPLDENEGAKGPVLLKIHLSLRRQLLREYEWVEEGKGYREFLVPAEVLNPTITKIEVAEDRHMREKKKR